MHCFNLSRQSVVKLLTLFLLSVTFAGIMSAQKPILKEYTVQKGETVYSIAKRNGLKEQDIYRHNPGTELGIREGQTLLIPVQNAKLPTTIKDVPPTHLGTYTIVAGDTFYAVARKFNISPAILRQYNPDIDPDKLNPGMVLRVAMPDGTPIEEAADHVVVIGENGLNTVRVALLLPWDQVTDPDRYVRFYEGFLMGVEELRRNGISMSLEVCEAPNEREVRNLLTQSRTLGKADLIIGGQSVPEINLLADFARKRGITYVSPFIAAPVHKDKNNAQSYFRLNTPQEELYPYLGTAFARFAKGGKKPLFVTIPGANHTAAVAAMKRELSSHKIPFETVALSQLSAKKLASSAYIIVPDDSKAPSLSRLLDLLEAQSGANSRITLFGYPEWQSYNPTLLKRLGAYNGTIYTTFFYDPGLDRESERFRKSYIAWFGKNIDSYFPKYSVLGYDVARFFIRAMATYGAAFPKSLAQLPADGLQNDFNFRSSDGAYSSVNLFFVTYDDKGNMTRRKAGSR